MNDPIRPLRTRREPPPLAPVRLVDRAELTARMLRLVFEGPSLADLVVDEPAASVRLLVPTPGSDELVMPTWNGNEFLLPDGERPALRTFTPRHVNVEAAQLTIDVVRHPGGAVSDWAETAQIGSSAAWSGPGAGYEFPVGADRLFVFGDETALPAIAQLFEFAPEGLMLDALVEIAQAGVELDLPTRDGDRVEWAVTAAGDTPGARLAEGARRLDVLADGQHVWAAGEASAVQAIRTHLFKQLSVSRDRAVVRGYWKPAR